MKVSVKKVLKLGFKILASITGGIAVYLGINKVSNRNKKKVKEEETAAVGINNYPVDNIESTGNKVINYIRVFQNTLNGVMNIVRSVGMISSTVKSLSNPNNSYQPDYGGYGYGGGYYDQRPWDYSNNDSAHFVRRSNNIIEVW